MRANLLECRTEAKKKLHLSKLCTLSWHPSYSKNLPLLYPCFSCVWLIHHNVFSICETRFITTTSYWCMCFHCIASEHCVKRRHATKIAYSRRELRVNCQSSKLLESESPRLHIMQSLSTPCRWKISRKASKQQPFGTLLNEVAHWKESWGGKNETTEKAPSLTLLLFSHWFASRLCQRIVETVDGF